jgi:hypothetical protein
MLLPTEFDPARYYLATHDPATGGYVVVDYGHGADELAQNLVVALQLMRRGEQVVLLAAVPGQRSPDALRNGEVWEFKRLSQAKNIPRAIEKSLLQKKGQANRFVLHIQQPYALIEVMRGLHKAVCNSQPEHLAVVAVLFPDNTLATLTRSQLEQKDFKALKKRRADAP